MRIVLALSLCLVPFTALAKKPPAKKVAAPTVAPEVAAPTVAPEIAAQKALMRKPAAMDHLRAFVVDDTCFPDDALTGSPDGSSLESRTIGDVKSTSVMRRNNAKSTLAEWKTWLQKFVKPGHKIGYGLSTLGDTYYGPKAVCLFTPAAVEAGEIGHIVNKLHPELEKVSYRIVFGDAEIEKLKKTPAAAHRLALVYDDDTVMMFADLDELRLATEAQVFTLVTF